MRPKLRIMCISLVYGFGAGTYERVEVEQTSLVTGQFITTLGLVDANLALRCHVVEVLVGVHAGLLRCGPGSSVHSGCSATRAILLLPVDKECILTMCPKITTKMYLPNIHVG